MKRRATRPSPMAWLKSALTQNLGLKAMCMLLALLLVAYQRSQEDERIRTVEFILNAQLPPSASGRELMTALPPTLKVAVQGSSNALDELARSSPRVELDLSNGTVEQLQFTPDLFDIPPRMRVGLIEPANLQLEWQDTVTRSVPVQCTVTGSVGERYEVQSQRVEPKEIELRGPASLVKVVQFVRAAPFDINGLGEGTFTRHLALDPPPNRTAYAGVSSANVTVDIRRRTIVVPFRKVTVEAVGIPGARTYPASVDVNVKGPPEVVKALHQGLVVPRADVRAFDTKKHGSTVVKVTVDLNGAEAEVQPPTVKVTW